MTTLAPVQVASPPRGPFHSILFDAAQAGRPVFLRLGTWPRGRWTAFEARVSNVLIRGPAVRAAALEHWRSADGVGLHRPGRDAG